MNMRMTSRLLMMILAALCGLFSGLQAGPGASQAAAPQTKSPLTVPETAQTIKVDGVLDEETWASALVIELGYEVAPGENVAPPVRTECLVISNASALMVAFRCFDPQPELIRAHYSDRDRIMSDDRIVFLLDTFNDERRNFEFAANPLGVQGDYIRLNENLDASWDAIWDCAGRIDDQGYVVEFVLPFDQLRFRKTEGPRLWGFAAYRIFPRSVERTIGVFPEDRNNNSRQSQMIKIQGFPSAVPGNAVEIAPTLTAVRTEDRPDGPRGGFQTRNKEAEFGLTAKWGLTPNMTLQGTVNPDFSQVEADAQQLDINQPFALFFQEKRPFFTEGADYFETLSNVEIEGLQQPIYTRAIRDPRWGFKLTGKEGANTFGLYSLQDGITNLVFPGPERSFSASLSSPTFLRSCATAMTSATGTRSGPWPPTGRGTITSTASSVLTRISGSANRTGSSPRPWARRPDTRDPWGKSFDQPDGPFSDMMWLVHYVHSARNYRFFADYQDVGGDFRADLGYIPKVGYTKAEIGGGLTWWGDGTGFLNRAVMNTSIRQMKKTDGSLMLRTFEIMGYLQGPGNTTVYSYFGCSGSQLRGPTALPGFQRLRLRVQSFGRAFPGRHPRLGG